MYGNRIYIRALTNEKIIKQSSLSPHLPRCFLSFFKQIYALLLFIICGASFIFLLHFLRRMTSRKSCFFNQRLVPHSPAFCFLLRWNYREWCASFFLSPFFRNRTSLSLLFFIIILFAGTHGDACQVSPGAFIIFFSHPPDLPLNWKKKKQFFVLWIKSICMRVSLYWWIVRHSPRSFLFPPHPEIIQHVHLYRKAHIDPAWKPNMKLGLDFSAGRWARVAGTRLFPDARNNSGKHSHRCA